MKRLLYIVGQSVFIAGVIVAGAYYWYQSTYYPSTDNAYVQADISQLAPSLSGPVTSVAVSNHQWVKKGELLYTIDPRPYQIALEAATANVALVKQNLAAKQDAVATALANIEQAKAQYLLDEKTKNRLTSLVAKGRLSLAEGDTITAKLAVSKAALAAAYSHYREAVMHLGKDGDNNAELQQANAARKKAELDLSFTTVLAPSDGKLTNFTLHPGERVQAGVPIAALIDLSHWWIDANLKETTLNRIHLGQAVIARIDLYPNHVFHGHVESISSGTGASFALLPPENASASWVKVTQRVPVKIVLDDTLSQPELRVGASATVTFDTLSA